MKASLLLASFISLSANAQVWVGDNAVWHYDFSNIAAGVGFYTIERNGDSLIGSQLCERYDISNTRFWYYTQPPGSGLSDTVVYDGEYFIESQFTYTSNDSVYRWDGGDFKLLFDFGAQVGDKWVITTQPNPWAPNCTDTAEVEVYAIGIENIQGVNYRTISLTTPIDAPWTLYGTFNERFGGDYIFPRSGDYPCQEFVAETDIIYFKCFEDDGMSLYNPSGEDCEYFLTHLAMDEKSMANMTLYPNPSAGVINITGSAVKKVEFFSTEGKEVANLTFEKPVNKFSVDGLNPGIYFVNLIHTEGERSNHRIIIK
jgi:hypothetical protein